MKQNDIKHDIERINYHIITENEDKDNVIDNIVKYRKKLSEIDSDIEDNIKIVEELKEEEKRLEKEKNQLAKIAEDNNKVV